MLRQRADRGGYRLVEAFEVVHARADEAPGTVDLLEDGEREAVVRLPRSPMVEEDGNAAVEADAAGVVGARSFPEREALVLRDVVQPDRREKRQLPEALLHDGCEIDRRFVLVRALFLPAVNERVDFLETLLREAPARRSVARRVLDEAGLLQATQEHLRRVVAASSIGSDPSLAFGPHVVTDVETGGAVPPCMEVEVDECALRCGEVVHGTASPRLPYIAAIRRFFASSRVVPNA